MDQHARKVRPAHAVEQPLLRVSPRDVDTLLSTLEVRFVALSECLVSAGFRLEMGGVNAPGLHYTIAGIAMRNAATPAFSRLPDIVMKSL
jgi:hypothetical protein